jgi:hypothetical protein
MNQISVVDYRLYKNRGIERRGVFCGGAYLFTVCTGDEMGEEVASISHKRGCRRASAGTERAMKPRRMRGGSGFLSAKEDPKALFFAYFVSITSSGRRRFDTR